MSWDCSSATTSSSSPSSPDWQASFWPPRGSARPCPSCRLSICFISPFRIAFAGSNLAFAPATSKPGVLAGVLLQPINPKAYAVNTVFFAGFSIMPEALISEIIWKIVIVNAIWLPIHVIWVWFGGQLKALNPSPERQRVINFAMASSMLLVVGLALWTQLRV